jgi:hypothetical protein
MFNLSSKNGKVQEVELIKNFKSVLEYYLFNINLIEALFFTGRRLTTREKEFIACVLMVIGSGYRNILDEESASIYSEVGNFSRFQTVRTYSNRPSIRKWLKKTKTKKGVQYSLPPIVEGLLKHDVVDMKILIKNGNG